jgi:hypothetical protein
MPSPRRSLGVLACALRARSRLPSAPKGLQIDHLSPLGELREGVGKDLVAVVIGVLVSQRRRRACVTCPTHQLGEGWHLSRHTKSDPSAEDREGVNGKLLHARQRVTSRRWIVPAMYFCLVPQSRSGNPHVVVVFGDSSLPVDQAQPRLCLTAGCADCLS